MNRFFLFLIYSFIFLVLGGSAIACFLDVSPFFCFSWETKEFYLNPFSDWGHLYKRFLYDNWAINSGKNLLIFLLFVFFYPAYIGLWFLVRRVKWLRLIFKPFTVLLPRKKIVVQKNPAMKSRFDRPQAMPQSKSFSSMAMAPVATTSTNVEADATAQTEQSVEGGSLSDGMESTLVSKPEELSPELKEQVKQIGNGLGYDLFENVLLDNITVPLVLATDTVAFLMTFLLEQREWIADEEAADEDLEPTWFSAEGLITSPFYLMSKAAERLKQQEPESEIIPVVVLCKGSILNAGALKSQWEEKNGFVVSFGKDPDGTLQTLQELLQKKVS